jgi:homeobox protein YOX1/YHP1
MQMSHPSLDRTTPSSRNSTHTQHPYSRDDPHIQRVSIELPPDPQAEQVIKKKRKRADARQLEVLNATYARTAFPSTEERAALAKQLDMSARSVQIWLAHAFCLHHICDF